MARIYVGTYAKYNSGSIAGKWLDCEDYSDKEEFLQACAELHSDESDPELMFQDWEDIPEGMVSESHVDAALWDWLELDEDDRNILAAYRENCGDSADIEQAREAYQGTYSNDEEFAQQLAEDLGSINDNANWPYTCIDWERAARELMFDYFAVDRDGERYYFRNI
jgi:antirestriction protein